MVSHIVDIEPSEEEPEYEVERIIGKRLGKDKQVEYLIGRDIRNQKPHGKAVR